MKMKNYIKSLSLCLILSGGSTLLKAADFTGGTGEPENPYLIANADQLSAIRNYLSAGICFKLTADIDLSTSFSGGWTPIGGYGNEFKGTLDGDGHSISNLYINTTANDCGLFSYLKEPAVIKNLTVRTSTEGITSTGNNIAILVGANGNGWTAAGSIENCSVYGKVSGKKAIGALVGESNGKIINCNAEAIVIATESNAGGITGYHTASWNITNCNFKGKVEAPQYAGGLAGKCESSAPISNCHVIASIIGTGNDIGGFIGYIGGSGDVTNCSFRGNVTGIGGVSGFIGTFEANRTISGCYTIATIDASGNNVGGFIGYSVYNETLKNNNSPSVKSCYAYATVKGNQRIGGFVGENHNIIEDCYAIGKCTAITQHVGGFAGKNSPSGKCYNCYATGTAAAPSYVGGFTGLSYNSGKYENCYFNTTSLATGNGCGEERSWDDSVTGITMPAGVSKLTETQMKQAASFTFSSGLWSFWEDKSYPYFNNQAAPLSVTSATTAKIEGVCKNDPSGLYLFTENLEGEALLASFSNDNLACTGALVSGAVTAGNQVAIQVQETGKIPSYPVFSTIGAASDIASQQIAPVTIELYPNPVTDVLFISSEEETSSIIISDLAGKTIINRQTLKTGEGISLQALRPGIYLVKIKTNRDIIVKKIIKL